MILFYKLSYTSGMHRVGLSHLFMRLKKKKNCAYINGYTNILSSEKYSQKVPGVAMKLQAHLS